jgi:opacity protein-like surface antigen
MRRRLALLVPAVLLSVATLGAPSAAAQSNVRIGGFLGAAFDNDEDWLIFGAEARLRGGQMQFDVQPRFHFQSFTGGSIMQLDGNILFNLTSSLSQIQPYMGFGAAFNRLSIDDDTPGVDSDDTNVGINLVSGLIIGVNPKWRPYVNYEYTIINDSPNGATIAIGILFQVSGTRFNSRAPVRR